MHSNKPIPIWDKHVTLFQIYKIARELDTVGSNIVLQHAFSFWQACYSRHQLEVLSSIQPMPSLCKVGLLNTNVNADHMMSFSSCAKYVKVCDYITVVKWSTRTNILLLYEIHGTEHALTWLVACLQGMEMRTIYIWFLEGGPERW